MNLTPKLDVPEGGGTTVSGERTVLYWRAPMNPTEIYDEPGRVWIVLAALYPLTHTLELTATVFKNRIAWGLPVAVRGSAFTRSTRVGHLKCASRPRQKSMISPGSRLWPSRGTTMAQGVSPHFSCGTPITAHSRMPGCW